MADIRLIELTYPEPGKAEEIIGHWGYYDEMDECERIVADVPLSEMTVEQAREVVLYINEIADSLAEEGDEEHFRQHVVMALIPHLAHKSMEEIIANAKALIAFITGKGG